MITMKSLDQVRRARRRCSSPWRKGAKPSQVNISLLWYRFVNVRRKNSQKEKPRLRRPWRRGASPSNVDIPVLRYKFVADIYMCIYMYICIPCCSSPWRRGAKPSQVDFPIWWFRSVNVLSENGQNEEPRLSGRVGRALTRYNARLRAKEAFVTSRVCIHRKAQQ